MFETEGILKYGPGIKAAVWLDKDIARYYLQLIPKFKYAKPQMYSTHITLVRTGIETPSNMSFWGKYEGELIKVSYENFIKFAYPYFYLDAYSERIGEIREELGLSRYRIPHPDSPYYNRYHITIGNVKENG